MAVVSISLLMIAVVGQEVFPAETMERIDNSAIETVDPIARQPAESVDLDRLSLLDSPESIQGLPEEPGVVVQQPPSHPEVIEETPKQFPDYWFSPHEESTDWLFGNANRFGMFSFKADWEFDIGPLEHLSAGYGFHFFNGPRITDMPPRVFDFYVGYLHKDWLDDNWGYEIGAHVGVFSDFEGSAREGVQFPGHALAYYRLNSCCQFLFGAQHLDRDDIPWLPVAGVVLNPSDDWRLELVFPRPRIAVRYGDNWFYAGGELGGGTWAIERDTFTNDVATYSDMQIKIGTEHVDEEGRVQFTEIAYVFDRRLEYRSGAGDFQPSDTLILRGGKRF